MESIDNTINEHNQKIIDHILSDFEIIIPPEQLPSISDIKNFVNVIVAANQTVPDIQNIAFGLESIDSTEDPILKSALYSLGTAMLHLTLRGDIPDENIKNGKTLLEWAIKIDPAYYEAYNHLGDCWMRIVGGFESAISCYKGALDYVQQETTLSDPEFKKFLDNFLGDNLFKIGICFIKLNRKSDAEFFLTLSKNIVRTDYQGLGELGLKSWDQVFSLLTRLS